MEVNTNLLIADSTILKSDLLSLDSRPEIMISCDFSTSHHYLNYCDFLLESQSACPTVPIRLIGIFVNLYQNENR